MIKQYISPTLHNKMLKRQWLLLFGFTLALCFFAIIMITFFDSLFELDESFGSTMDSFVAQSVFASLLPEFAIPMFIMMAWRIGHKAVYHNSITAYFTAGVSRRKYVGTSAMYMVTALLIITLAVFLVSIMFMGGINNFGSLLLVAFLVMLGVGSIAFIAWALSLCLAGKKYAMLSIIVPILLMLFAMIMTNGFFRFVPYLSPLGWVNSYDMMNGGSRLWWLAMLGYIAIITTCIIVTQKVFKKRNLSI